MSLQITNSYKIGIIEKNKEKNRENKRKKDYIKCNRE